MASSSEPRQRGFIPPQSDEERLLVRRVAELAGAVRRDGAPRFTAFLSDREQALALSALHKQQWADFTFEGGHEGAERKLLCLYDGEAPERPFPAHCLQLEAQHPAAPLTHRDYLGALLSLGLRRECTGDIIVDSEGSAYAFVLDSAAPLVLSELVSVGRCAVRVSEASAPGTAAAGGTERTASVSSLRLDAVLAAMLHVSRGQAAALIHGGGVSVNHVDTACVHADVYENDVFSIRGHGKFKLSKIGAQSKKGRTFISYLQY